MYILDNKFENILKIRKSHFVNKLYYFLCIFKIKDKLQIIFQHVVEMPTISLAYLNNSSLNYSSTTSVTLATSFRTLIKLDHSIYLKLTIIILIILVILLVIFFVIKCDKQKQTSQIPFEKFQLSTHSSISLEDDACDCNNVSQYIKAFSNDLM